MHGGRSPRGTAAGRFKHGRYSKHLPARLAADYEAAEADPDLLSLRAETALFHARISQLLSQLDTGESGRLWERLHDAWSELEVAQASADAAKFAAALAGLRDAIFAGNTERMIWQELREMIHSQQSVARSEQVRLKEMQQTMTAEQAMALFAALEQAVMEVIPDREVRSRLARRLGELMNLPPRTEGFDGERQLAIETASSPVSNAVAVAS
jgi:hypothetical protein